MSCDCPPKNKSTRTQFAAQGGPFSRTLPTTTCNVCDAPGKDSLTTLGFPS